MITQALNAYLQSLKHQGLYRFLRVNPLEKGLCSFSSSDYLSLREDKVLQAAFARGFTKIACGSGASMVVSGYHPEHQALEREFACLFRVDSALLFNSGYAANLGVMAMLAKVKAKLLIDKGVHASIYDGIKLAGGLYQRYIHQDFQSLKKKIQPEDPSQLIVTEAIFSMSGQKTKLDELNLMAKIHGLDLIIDEAHAFGILGPQGLGLVAEHGLGQERIPLRIIPFGKAMAAQGAIVLGQGAWVDGVLQSARSYIYSTAMSPALAYGLSHALDKLTKADDKRQSLREVVIYFQKKVQESLLPFRDSSTPIQQLQLGCPKKALELNDFLRQQGLICQAMREPTVTQKETGLRIVLNAHHEAKDIDRLFLALEAWRVKD